MDVVTNCPPWTVRRLASHALKNQLFWAGLVTGQDAHGAGGVDGRGARTTATWRRSPPRSPRRCVELWRSDGVLTAQHETPFGVLPGAVVVNFALIDAAAHAWDLSASLGRAIEFPAEWIPAMTDVVALTCTDHAVELGLVKPPTEPPADATDTERLMAAAGGPSRADPSAGHGSHGCTKQRRSPGVAPGRGAARS